MTKRFTQYFMLATGVTWGLVDLFLYFKYGNAATISASSWFDAYMSAGFTFAWGTLAGHFFGQRRAPTTASIPISDWWSGLRGLNFLILVMWLLGSMWQAFAHGTSTALDIRIWELTGHRVWVVFLAGFAEGAIFFQFHEPSEEPPTNG